MIENTCCFSGNRPKCLPWIDDENSLIYKQYYIKLRQLVINSINEGYENFVCGGAIGGDLMFAKIIIELKKVYNITLEFALPFKDHTTLWKREQKEQFNKLTPFTDTITYVSIEPYQYKSIYFIRNRYMIDKSSKIISLWNGLSKGTGYTIKYAINHGLKYEILSV